MAHVKETDAYILDTYRGSGGKYSPGAVTYCGRKRMDMLRWDQQFSTQEEADAFVRQELAESHMTEVLNEGELKKRS